jgi:hypothetical protein
MLIRTYNVVLFITVADIPSLGLNSNNLKIKIK